MAVQADQKPRSHVSSVEAKPATRNPSAPFMTSTLQQEASRKFGMGARQTMSAAQRLYEAGLITYMRTDGIDMAPEAVHGGARRDQGPLRRGLRARKSPRMYKNKAKNAQEAHECIRPTDMTRDAGKISVSDADQRKLYDLIWKRTLACQMEAARLERTTVEIGSEDGQVGLRATGQVVLFDGFLKRLRGRPRRRCRDDDDDKRLPQIMQGEPFAKKQDGADRPAAHHSDRAPVSSTSPSRRRAIPRRRWSRRWKSWASAAPRPMRASGHDPGARICPQGQNRLIPEDKGRIVTIFLLNFFRKYVGYEFTANLEEELDRVSAGEKDYKEVLAASGAISRPPSPRPPICGSPRCSTCSTRRSPPRSTPRARTAPTRANARSAAPAACISKPRAPAVSWAAAITPNAATPAPSAAMPPKTATACLARTSTATRFPLRSGRFGPYVQRGEATEDNKKPPRASLPKGWKAEEMDAGKGAHPAEPAARGGRASRGRHGESNFGRYGPYIMHQGPTTPNPSMPTSRTPMTSSRSA